MVADPGDALYRKGGAEQLKDELEAYNPLIPNGSELVATFMIEIDDPVRRDFMLRKLGHIDDKVYLSIAGEKIYAVPEQEVERTTEDGKTSAIHFLHFPMTPGQRQAFKDTAVDVQLGIEHNAYSHITPLIGDVRTALAEDLID